MLCPLISSSKHVKTMNCSNKIHIIPRYNSNPLKMEHFLAFVLVWGIAPLACQLIKACSGFGLVVMQTMINYLPDNRRVDRLFCPPFTTTNTELFNVVDRKALPTTLYIRYNKSCDSQSLKISFLKCLFPTKHSLRSDLLGLST